VVKVPLHPPLAVVVISHAANDAFMVPCDWQAASVLSVAQVNTTSGAVVTVKVFVQVTGDSQSLVSVHVTVDDPPQADGGPVLLLVSTQLQLHAEVAEASHVAYAVFTADWDWQAATV
jgi:hypothetical protein